MVQGGVEGPEVTQHGSIWQSDSNSQMPLDPKEAKGPAVYAVSLGTLCHGRHPFGYSSGINFLYRLLFVVLSSREAAEVSCIEGGRKVEGWTLFAVQ